MLLAISWQEIALIAIIVFGVVPIVVGLIVFLIALVVNW